jgi:hypothetical protein
MPCTLLLIFGTSHTGKSTLAARLGAALGWPVTSTDMLARHPGRPWPEVRPQVAEFYASLTDPTILWFLHVHHENMRPLLLRTIADAAAAGTGAILEGSALRPGYVAGVDRRQALAVGLHAPPGFLRARMEAESGHARQDEPRRHLIERFITRSLADNEAIVAEARRLGLRLVDVSDPGALDRLAAELATVLAPGQA